MQVSLEKDCKRQRRKLPTVELTLRPCNMEHTKPLRGDPAFEPLFIMYTVSPKKPLGLLDKLGEPDAQPIKDMLGAGGYRRSDTAIGSHAIGAKSPNTRASLRDDPLLLLAQTRKAQWGQSSKGSSVKILT